MPGIATLSDIEITSEMIEAAVDAVDPDDMLGLYEEAEIIIRTAFEFANLKVRKNC